MLGKPSDENEKKTSPWPGKLLILHIPALNETAPVCCARYLLLLLVIVSGLRSIIQDSALKFCFIWKDGVLLHPLGSDRDRRPVAPYEFEDQICVVFLYQDSSSHLSS